MLPLGVGEVQQHPLPHLRSIAQLYMTKLQHIAFKQHSSVCLAEFLSVLSPPLFFFFPPRIQIWVDCTWPGTAFAFSWTSYFVSRTQAFHFLPLQTSNKLTAPNLRPTNNDMTFQFHNN